MNTTTTSPHAEAGCGGRSPFCIAVRPLNPHRSFNTWDHPPYLRRFTGESTRWCAVQGGPADGARDGARGGRLLVRAGPPLRSPRHAPAGRILREPGRAPHRRRATLQLPLHRLHPVNALVATAVRRLWCGSGERRLVQMLSVTAMLRGLGVLTRGERAACGACHAWMTWWGYSLGGRAPQDFVLPRECLLCSSSSGCGRAS